MKAALAAALLCVVGLALYGWGALVRRLCRRPAGHWTVTIGLGLAAWIFLGGVLAAAHLAVPASIGALGLVGLGLGIARVTAVVRKLGLEAVWPSDFLERPFLLGAAALVVLIAAACLSLQLAPSLFNHADDLQKYFAHVTRLVETGTVSGSLLNALGSETLGAQAFLHAPVVAWFGLRFINASDAVFCFLLTVLLAGGVAIGRHKAAAGAVVAMLLTAGIDPIFVNVGPLYSGSALMLTAIFLTLDPRENPDAGTAFSSPAVLGLIYAALLALKPTFALFIAIHVLSCAAGELTAPSGVLRLIRRGAATAAWSVGFLVPWIVPYLSYVLDRPAAENMIDRPVPALEHVNPFSTARLFYGENLAEFTLLMAVVVMCGALALRGRRPSDARPVAFAALCVGAAAGYVLMLYVVGPELAGAETALRHYVPMMTAFAAAATALPAVLAPASGKTPPSRLSAILGAVAVLAFSSSLIERVTAAIEHGTMLAYVPRWDAATFQGYADAGTRLINGTASLGELQQLIPAGEPVLLWITAPFQFDFRRNPIADVDIAGLGTPWSKMPAVSYVVWQYSGFGVRTPADYQRMIHSPGVRETYIHARALAFANFLSDLAHRSTVIYADEMVVVMKIPDGTTWP